MSHHVAAKLFQTRKQLQDTHTGYNNMYENLLRKTYDIQKGDLRGYVIQGFMDCMSVIVHMYHSHYYPW